MTGFCQANPILLVWLINYAVSAQKTKQKKKTKKKRQKKIPSTKKRRNHKEGAAKACQEKRVTISELYLSATKKNTGKYADPYCVMGLPPAIINLAFTITHM